MQKWQHIIAQLKMVNQITAKHTAIIFCARVAMRTELKKKN